MSKTKIYQAYELPRTVVDVVRAVCADYGRRAKLIKASEQSGGNDLRAVVTSETCIVTSEIVPDGLEMCVFLNEIVDGSLESIEAKLRPMIFEDICEKRGYEHSPAASIISKNAYYMRKRKFLYDIAVLMSLI